uniref:Uncharacterized protein n=1 Tax=Tetraselmis sp. GSL018 TaxID=582737 RepID=A0A061QNS6_9CHLO|mmetsp:Transcript_17953/g.43040  ORF Transcript_17953/g.43040 Transcript_17953/m.43040 type:complete len:221 (+) Transcript_17953:121-783(+)
MKLVVASSRLPLGLQLREAKKPASLRAQEGLCTTRRTLSNSLLLSLAASVVPVYEARAVSARDLVKGFLRPSTVSPDDAIVQLLDARGTALELQMLANTPKDSRERFEARSSLPGMAAALRKVQDAAPTALQLIIEDVESSIGSRYGGDATAGEQSALDAVYSSVGRVLTISGRTIRAEALEEGSTLSGAAAARLDEFLSLLPASALGKAQAFREARSES